MGCLVAVLAYFAAAMLFVFTNSLTDETMWISIGIGALAGVVTSCVGRIVNKPRPNIDASQTQSDEEVRQEPTVDWIPPEQANVTPAANKKDKGAIKMVKNSLCPYCLNVDSIADKSDKNEQNYACISCKSNVPREYVNYGKIPREVVSAVGFRGHGKTVYFASLFHTLNDLASFWPGFYTFAVDEKSLETVRDNAKLLKTGALPDATLMNFPAPTIVRFSNMPSLGHRFFLFYDTSGEAYARQSALIQHASFVKHSRTVIFIISLDDLEHDGQRAHDLLSVYVQGLTELKGNTKEQRLLVVFSKADLLEARLQNQGEIWHYLQTGRLENLGNVKLNQYVKEMKRISKSLGKFIRYDLKDMQFLNFAQDRFKGVDFCIVSALGSEPAGARLRDEVTPKRIIDPILWVACNE